MKVPQNLTIRRKLILWFAAILTIVLVLFGAALYGVTRFALVRVVDNALSNSVDEVIANANAYPLSQFNTPEEVIVDLPDMDVFTTGGMMVQAWRIDANGYSLVGSSRNIAEYPEPLDPAALTSEVRLLDQDSVGMTMWSNTNINDGAWRVISQPVNIFDRMFVLQAAMPLDQVNESSRWLLLIIAIEMGLALVGTSALGWSMAKRAMHRIDVITDAASGIVSRDDLKTRLPYDGPMDEIGRLTNVFNAMMDRIQHMFGVQQRFVADVSHELRTPLTAVRGHLDLVRRYGMDPESMDALEGEVARMNRLVNDLLMLARADYGGISLDKREMDMDELVSEIYRDTKVLAKNRDLKINVADYEPVRVNGDADRLKQALLNLVGNAIKFTPDGGSITLNLRRTDSDAVIEVVDTGLGISHEDQKRVFDRFFQTDESRARGLNGTPGNDGVGLGLSIAKWITEAHDGTISVHSEPGEGSTFTIRIPHVERRVNGNDAVTRQRTSLIRRDRTSQQASVSNGDKRSTRS